MADCCATCGQPLPLLAAQEPKRRSTAKGLTTFNQWAATREEGKPLIPRDSAAFKYAEKVKLPEEYLELAWLWFQSQYRGKAKKYRDWPAAFLNSVKGNWSKYWGIDRDENFYLTTAGKQAQMEHRNRNART